VHSSSKSITTFLLLAFVPAWLLWEVPLLLGLSQQAKSFQLLVIIGAFAPAAAAIIVRKWVTQEGFRDAGLELHLDRWPYYLAALVIPIAVVGFDAVAAPALGIARPTISSSQGAPLSLMAAQLVLVSLFASPILWGEEFGWRSYLQLHLFPSRPLLAAISTGMIWGIWHFPLLLSVPELPLHPYLTLVLFPIGTILYSIVLGSLRVQSGSIWTSSLAHSALNNFRSPMVALLFSSQADMLGVALLGLVPLAMIAAAIVALGGLRRRAPHAKNGIG